VKKFTEAAESKIREPLYRLQLASSTGYLARISEVSTVLIDVNNKLAALENRSIPEMFQIDVLLRNHLGSSVEDLRRFIGAGLDDIPKRGEPVATAGSILGRVDTTLSEIKFILQNPSSPAFKPIDVKSSNLTKGQLDAPSRTAIGRQLDGLDSKLTSIEQQLVELASSKPSQPDIDVAQHFKSLGQLSQLMKLNKLDSLQELKKISKMDETVRQSIGHISTIAKAVTTRLSTLEGRLKSLDHLHVDSEDRVTRAITDKSNKIMKLIHDVDKRVYNTEVRIYELKPVLRDAATKLDSKTEDMKKMLNAIRTIEDRISTSNPPSIQDQQGSVVKLLGALVDSKVATPVSKINDKMDALADDFMSISNEVANFSQLLREQEGTFKEQDRNGIENRNGQAVHLRFP
jgi:hypothetical protein